MSSGIETDDIIEPWLFATLSGDVELMGLVDQYLINAAEDQAPTEVDAYLLYSLSSARDVRGVAVRQQVDSLYLVKAVVRGGSYDPASVIMRKVDALLSVEGSVTTTGGSLTCTRETITKYPERSDGVSYRHLGATYRILASSST